MRRVAFRNLLPEVVVRRPGERFSDGAGYGWIDALEAPVEERVDAVRMAWDGDLQNVNDPSERTVKGVHRSAW